MRNVWLSLAVGLLAVATAPASLASSTVTTSIVGRLVDAEGQGRAHETVVLYAWPNNDVLRRMKLNDSAPLTPIASASTGSDGRFTLSPSSQALVSASDRFGNVNADLRAVFADGTSQLLTSTGLKRSSDQVNGTSQSTAQVGTLHMSETASSARPTQSVALPNAPSCSTVYKSDLGNRGVWIGGHYSTKSSITHKLVYSEGATSTLGIGVSTSGVFGTFKASGSAVASSTAEESYPSSTGLQHDYTYFDYGKYALTCDGVPISYSARVRYFAGGAWTYAPSAAPAAKYCVPQASGSGFTKSTSKAYTDSTGADTSGAIGIDLSSRTGYTSTAKVTFTFHSASSLCGTNGAPGSTTPLRLVGK